MTTIHRRRGTYISNAMITLLPYQLEKKEKQKDKKISFPKE